MNWKYFLLGISTGLASAFLLKEAAATRKEKVSPEDVLEQVKQAFKKEGSISGSWINMKAEAFLQSPIEYHVYKGGISRNVNGETERYEFTADASTGTVLEITPLT